ncbi:MAG: YHS domain-containing (seleno)protein, partial [Pseudomonadota bacterium]
MKLRTLFLAAAISIAPVAIAPIALADAPEYIYTKKGDVAVSGYDPVAYFTVGAPTKGNDQFASTYQGATYLFSSAENKAKFDADPAIYAPQYGGYCAWAISQG